MVNIPHQLTIPRNELAPIKDIPQMTLGKYLRSIKPMISFIILHVILINVKLDHVSVKNHVQSPERR